MAQLPSGTVTFLFTDVEGSTRLWEEHPEAMHGALAGHDELLRDAIEGHDGHVVKTTGDGVHGVFATARSALDAAVVAQRSLCSEPWGEQVSCACASPFIPVRRSIAPGITTGRRSIVPHALMSVGRGQQVLVSNATEQIVGDDLPPGLELVDLGEHQLRDLSSAERVFQVVHPELPARFPPLRAVDVSATLPLPSTSFHGRSHELDELATSVLRPGTVTLVGPGGVGKTRLALELTSEVGHRFRDGVRIIDLAPIAADAVPPRGRPASVSFAAAAARSGTASSAGWAGSTSSSSSTTASTCSSASLP